MNRTEVGTFGEGVAIEYLTRKGFEILDRNFHSRYGEIDIIARDRKYIVFAEIKTRKNGALVTGAEAVNKQKQRKIIKTALSYLLLNNTYLQPRFDVIEVTVKSKSNTICGIEHIKGAFIEEEDYEAF